VRTPSCEKDNTLRYFISILVCATIAAFWYEVVIKRASPGIGLCGIFGIACVGIAIANVVSKLLTGHDPSQPPESGPSAGSNATWNDAKVEELTYVIPTEARNQASKTRPIFNETVLTPARRLASTAGIGEWFIIQAGREYGPFTIGELVEQVVIGNIKADDLITNENGFWNRACEFDFLRGHLPQQEPPQQQTPSKPASSEYVSISKPALVVGACAALLAAILIGVLVQAKIERESSQRVLAEQSLVDARHKSEIQLEKLRQVGLAILDDLEHAKEELRKRDVQPKPLERIEGNEKPNAKADEGLVVELKRLEEELTRIKLDHQEKLAKVEAIRIEAEIGRVEAERREKLLEAEVAGMRQATKPANQADVETNNRTIFANAQKFVDAHPKIQSADFTLSNFQWERVTRPFRTKTTLTRYEHEQLLDFLGRAIKHAPYDSDRTFMAVIAELKAWDFGPSKR
jgi:hypothetical protein